MAGLGRKVFAAGEVLTAANVMGYLMDQSVMVFDDATDRTSTLGTAVAEGMMAYLKDTNGVQVYDGSSWVPVVSDPTLTASTATAYTVASSDAGNFLRFTAGAGTITVGTATGFTSGQQVQIITEGTAWSIVPEGTAVELYGRGTAQGTAGFLAESPYDAFSIISVGSNAYRIIGNVSAV